MKYRLLTAFLAAVIVIFVPVWPLAAQETVSVSGRVVDAGNGRGIADANIVLRGTGIGTVTNEDGIFSLVIPVDADSRNIDISHLGYGNASLNLPVSEPSVVVKLTRVTPEIQAITIYGGDVRHIVSEALKRIPDNYSSTDDMLSVFYRETLMKGSRYIEISEAIMNVSKSPYVHRTIGRDRVQLRKGRTLVSGRKRDTLSVKIAGGPNLAVVQDFVKNADFFLSREDLLYYDFTMTGIAEFNERNQFAIRIEPNTVLDYPLFRGMIYIDVDDLSFTRAEIEIDMSDEDMVSRTILRRKPFGLSFAPLRVGFTVAYRHDGGEYFLSYVRNEMSFKCDWRKRLFHATYTTVSEMVSVDRNVNADFIIQRRDAFSSTQSMSDIIQQYWDEDFWQGYNIIEPTESLERAVTRLRRTRR